MPKTQGLIPLRERVRELDRIYGTAEKAIARELALMDIGNYQELRTVKTQEKTSGTIKMLNRAAIKWTRKAVPEAYVKAEAIARARLEIIGAEKSDEFSYETHNQAIEDDAEVTADFLIKANQSIKLSVAAYLYFVRQASEGLMQIQEFDFRDEEFIASLLDDAIRAGESRGKVKKLIVEHIQGEVGEGKFIQIRGRNYNMRKYADGVAKTRLRTVQTDAVLNSCEEYENDLVEVSAHGTECLICIPYEGNVYSLSGKSTVYPYLDAYPPFHPRCQHSIRPTSEAALEWRAAHA